MKFKFFKLTKIDYLCFHYIINLLIFKVQTNFKYEMKYFHA